MQTYRTKHLLALCLTFVLLLTGCAQYSSWEKRHLIKTGRVLMENYLSTHVPGGKVLTAEAKLEQLQAQGSSSYLSEYVYGQYSDPDGTWTYYANTRTGQLYTSKHFVQLKKLVMNKVLERLGLEGKAEVTHYSIPPTTLPHQCKEFDHNDRKMRFFGERQYQLRMKDHHHVRKQGVYYPSSMTMSYDDVLPVDFTDMKGFLASANRQKLTVEWCEITLPAGGKLPQLAEDDMPLRFDGIEVEVITFKWKDDPAHPELLKPAGNAKLVSVELRQWRGVKEQDNYSYSATAENGQSKLTCSVWQENSTPLSITDKPVSPALLQELDEELRQNDMVNLVSFGTFRDVVPEAEHRDITVRWSDGTTGRPYYRFEEVAKFMRNAAVKSNGKGDGNDMSDNQKINQHNEPGKLVFDYYDGQAGLPIQPGYDEYTLTTTDDPAKLQLDVHSRPTGDGEKEVKTTHLVSAKVLEDVMALVAKHKMADWGKHEYGGICGHSMYASSCRGTS